MLKADDQFDLIVKNLIKNIDLVSKEISISSTTIENNCVCSICLSIFNKTVITNCLHRFCRECIVKNMGVNSICKNTCPLCRNHISSCRSIYQDKAMDALVGLYKDFKNRNAKIQIIE